jgi:hypothetical protein
MAIKKAFKKGKELFSKKNYPTISFCNFFYRKKVTKKAARNQLPPDFGGFPDLTDVLLWLQQ